MSDPASSAAGGVAAWKIAGGILSIGVVASALGFMVLLPRTPREAAMRLLATMIGSAVFGPVLVFAAFSQWPGLFNAGITIATRVGLEPWLGMFMAAAPLLAMAGLPFWWILGALVLWFDKRKGKDHCCHSFVGCNGAQPGQIIYLSDCTHAMAGQVVDLPPYPENWKS